MGKPSSPTPPRSQCRLGRCPSLCRPRGSLYEFVRSASASIGKPSSSASQNPHPRQEHGNQDCRSQRSGLRHIYPTDVA